MVRGESKRHKRMVTEQLDRLAREHSGVSILERGRKLLFNRMVRYPVSELAKRVLMPFLGVRLRIAVERSRRVNPYDEMKVSHLAAYAAAGRPLDLLTMKKFKRGLQRVKESYSLGDDEWKTEYVRSLRKPFSDYQLDASAGAGWPFRPGVKKGDVRDEANEMAEYELNNGCPAYQPGFDCTQHSIYAKYDCGPHMYYTGGRGKIRNDRQVDSGRVVQYAGTAQTILTLAFLTPTFDRLASLHSVYAIGMSWFYGGMHKLYLRFETFFKRHNIVSRVHFSLDISGWDYSLSYMLFEEVQELFLELHDSARSSMTEREYVNWRIVIVCTFEDLIYRRVWILDVVIQLTGGMPSGFGGTAGINTLIHEAILRGEDVDILSMRVMILLYGDDNRGGCSALDWEEIRKALLQCYSNYGLKVKYIHESPNFSRVDFLSTTAVLIDGIYYPTREAEDFFCKMVYPDVPLVDDTPEMVVARLVGGLSLVWKDKELAVPVLKAIQVLYEEHHMSEIRLSPRDAGKVSWTLKNLGWKDIPLSQLPSFMDGLHAHLLGETALAYARLNAEEYVKRWDPDAECDDPSVAMAVEDMCNALSDKRALMDDIVDRDIKRKISPFGIMRSLRGHAGAKVSEIINTHKPWFSNMKASDIVLMIGTHPGSDARAAKMAFPGNPFVFISSMAPNDTSGFMHKVRSMITPRDRMIKEAFDERQVENYSSFGLVSIDAAIGREHCAKDYSRWSERSARNQMKLVLPMFESTAPRALVLIVKLVGLSEDMLPTLYRWYRRSKGFDLQKVHASYPWNGEFHVTVLKYGKDKRFPMKYNKFKGSVYAFWEKHCDTRLSWNYLRQRALRSKKVEVNPKQTDPVAVEAFRSAVAPVVIIPGTGDAMADCIHEDHEVLESLRLTSKTPLGDLQPAKLYGSVEEKWWMDRYGVDTCDLEFPTHSLHRDRVAAIFASRKPVITIRDYDDEGKWFLHNVMRLATGHEDLSSTSKKQVFAHARHANYIYEETHNRDGFYSGVFRRNPG
jgi:hypothetical protein